MAGRSVIESAAAANDRAYLSQADAAGLVSYGGSGAASAALYHASGVAARSLTAELSVIAPAGSPLFQPVSFPTAIPIVLPRTSLRAHPQYDSFFSRRRAFERLTCLEMEMRPFIDRVMTDKFGPEWVKHKIHAEIIAKWEKRRQDAVSDGEAPLPLVWYADLGEYAGILTRKDSWDAFGRVFGRSKEELQVALRRLAALRRPTMHARPLKIHDVLGIEVEVQWILEAIGRHNH